MNTQDALHTAINALQMDVDRTNDKLLKKQSQDAIDTLKPLLAALK